MRTTTSRALVLALAAAGCTSAGCTSSGGEDAGSDLGAAWGSLSRVGSLAFVRVERSLPVEVAAGRVVTNVKVARYSGLEAATVLKLLGADLREGDTCAASGRLDDFPMAPEARVELLSIGPVSLRAGELSTTFSPRLFPDLATTASGWFYAGDLDPALAGVDEYVLSAPGEHAVGRFEVSVAAPGEVLGLELGGARFESDGSLKRTSDAELAWEPEDMRDRIELELYSGGSLLSCSVRDDGHFVLPQSKLQGLEIDENASFVVRRVRVVATEMQGIENAYVRAATARTLTLRVE